jgi:hypothetical protein
MADVNGDSIGDLAVGTELEDGGQDHGGIFVLFLATTGSVKSFARLSDTAGSFTGRFPFQNLQLTASRREVLVGAMNFCTGILYNGDLFGISVTALADVNGDSVVDLAVGAFGDGDGGYQRGAVYIAFPGAQFFTSCLMLN